MCLLSSFMLSAIKTMGGRAVAEQETYWQQEDKSTIGKVFLMVGVFAVVMAVVAVVVGFIL